MLVRLRLARILRAFGRRLDPGLRSAAATQRQVRRTLRPRNPAQAIAAGFLTAMFAGTFLLMLPAATPGEGGATFLEAWFTATSALCVTGLIVVDTPTYWSGFGEGVIATLIQLGGFGVMSFSALLGVFIMGKLNLRTRVMTAAETKHQDFGDIRALLIGIVKVSLLTEATAAVVLFLRFWLGYDETLPQAAWNGVFHSISAFNNAGFALYSDSLMRYAGDWIVSLTIAGAVITGGLGFPVILELRKRFRRPHHWSMHTKIVLWGTAILLTAGTVFFALVEWTNRAAIGNLDGADRLLAAFFHSTMSRTAGFNSVDIAELHPVSWLATDILMFIGGGPAGTAGGLKITTFAVLFFILWAEIRGESAVNIFHKRLSRSVHRQAISVVLLSLAAIMASTVFLMLITDFGQERILFEVVSAYATVGLSTGITADLPAAGQVVIIFLMFLGRLGPVTLATSLAVRHRKTHFEYPKERPLIG
ncbi:TrkH family potassium uptake protein [Zhihengliuella salsuginis]|uniref:Potassium transporter Trk n=1 Tax=Zhihengliuella salsuginis TaxID=578222 RepID=A0ABQ3GJF8_9MICC|nr:potassium transporter TrkG [Zhihengliuella salsuginis]GHD10642.1 potassium transporter Trk [Zhihengliuella salsuginis]